MKLGFSEDLKLKNVHKLLAVLILVSILITGCRTVNADYEYDTQEQPKLVREEIDVTVTDVYCEQVFSGIRWNTVTIYVESQDYGVFGNYTFKSVGWLDPPKQGEYKEGDIIKAELYSWVIENTGEIVDLKINRVY